MTNMIRNALAAACLMLAAALASAQSRDLPDFTDLVEKQGPAVVNISTTQVVHAMRGGPQFQSPFGDDDPMAELFRRFGQHPMPGIPHDYESKSLGSGFIVGADGLILTNAHVVNDADEVLVRLTDKREFKAKVLGADRRTDVALIKINARGLPVVKLGDASKLKVGEWVVAIGSPFGFDNSVTAGIVSAKGRQLPQENYVPFIQTDAAINPGNSGGPLFNMRGEVVGINSQIFSRSGGYMGLSFAIPIDVALDIKNQLQTNGRVSRGRIGVAVQELTKEMAESFGLSKLEGALVAKVEKGSPADKAGLADGDVILKFDGKAVAQSADLSRYVGSTRPGTQSILQVWRDGKLKTLTVTVGEMPSEDAKPGGHPGKRRGKAAEPQASNRFGLALSDLTAEQKQQAGIDNGILVEDVRNGLRGDLQPGDLILGLMHKGVQTEVKSVEQFNSLLGKIDKSATLTLLVKRGEAQVFVTIKGVGEK
ncbi:putative periplasmic serine endoprotease DegP-like [Georgfuchsia toluolica]|uniref:Probable periplasmic serine endoprotease DegP-like n=1 Tax=Georgfuchsia toluolica TaxID=424218 RepID=A0A916J440_9PROT|nr:putative periplasmic serine endoprotease DegP-like [Georgfuchsia toluolica]